MAGDGDMKSPACWTFWIIKASASMALNWAKSWPKQAYAQLIAKYIYYIYLIVSILCRANEFESLFFAVYNP